MKRGFGVQFEPIICSGCTRMHFIMSLADFEVEDDADELVVPPEGSEIFSLPVDIGELRTIREGIDQALAMAAMHEATTNN